ncbi:MAG: hypothetical protein ABIQ60_13080 [Burkholderiaceae bacterium]
MFARPGAERDLTDISAWAQQCGYSLKRARGDDGFVVDGALAGKPWRIEWGPPHRHYIEGHELRLRMELGLPSDMQMLVLSRSLMEALERETFEEFTDNVQTQIGTKTPEEMRWLVMFPKVDLSGLKALRARYGAVASVPPAGLTWLVGPLATTLEQAVNGFLGDDPPFVLMTLRGRAYLRMQLADPEPAAVAAALAVFETAVARALGCVDEFTGKGAPPDTAATTAWQGLQLEDDAPGSPPKG